jgi:SAM-dependent methyltransferase
VPLVRVWEWVVDEGADRALLGVSRSRDRAMTVLSQSLITVGTPASGRVVPVGLVEGASGFSYVRMAPVFTADCEKGVAVAGFDVSVPNVARIYDYLLGGKDNYAADRDAAEELRTVLPDVEVACRQNRAFHRRAVTYLAGEAGIGQFVDIGSGLPTASNTHQIARAARPGARVVYVDNDPVVVGHGRALLERSPDVAVIDADLRDPGAIVTDRSLTKLVDFTQPVAFLLVAVLHFIPDEEDPCGIVEVLQSVMAPGSFLVISHVTQDDVSFEEYAAGVSVYEKSSAPVVPRRYNEVLRFFVGTDLIDPGLVNISRWRTDGEPTRQLIYGGVACQRS